MSCKVFVKSNLLNILHSETSVLMFSYPAD